MLDGSDLFFGGVLPAVAAASALAMVWRVTGKAASAWRTAIVLGYVVGHWALDARTIGFVAALSKSYQPTEARDWLPLLILLAIVPDALACVGRRGSALAWLLRIALCLFIPWRLLHNSAYLPIGISSDFDFDLGGWSIGEATAWIGGIGAVLLIGWQWLRIVDQQSDVLVRSALAVVATLGAAIVSALSASLVYGQMFGVLTAALAGCSLAAMILSTGRGPEAAAGPVLVVFGSLLVAGHFYAELKIHHAGLLWVAVAVAIGWLPLSAKLPPRWQAIGRSVLCIATLGGAVALASLDFAATQEEAESNPYHNLMP